MTCGKEKDGERLLGSSGRLLMETRESSTPSGGLHWVGAWRGWPRRVKRGVCSFKSSVFIGLILIQVERSQQIENDCH